MIVNPLTFVEAMEKHWSGAINSALKQSWKQQAQTFNEHITGTNTHPWSVLCPPTGTGKTQGLALYCSMLSLLDHPGVLIVVRMKEDADNLAEKINQLAKLDVALSVHTDSKHEHKIIHASPVLIVTHSAYERAMLIPLNLDALTCWRSGKRKLTVIDERLNIIKYDQVYLDDLRQLRGHIPHSVLLNHPMESVALDIAIQKLEALTTTGSVRLAAEDWNCSTSFSGLREALKTLLLDKLVLQTTSSEERSRLASRHIESLTRLEAIMQNWSLYARKGKQHILTTGRVIIPRELMSAVIMDATAALDPIYDLLGDAIHLITPPENIRSYANVTLHISTGHKVGKQALSKAPERDASAFMTGLSRYVADNSKLLICTHKASKPHLEGYGANVVNWGAIDGKNDWKGCNTVALFGLFYLDRIQPEVSLIALQKWAGHNFTDTEYSEAIEELYWGHVAVTAVQAINRVQCRTMIDEQGNCHPTDVYVLLPEIKRAKNITQPIARAMPGIKGKMWVSHAAKKRLRRSGYEAPLVSCLASLGRGKHLARAIREQLKIPQRAFEKLIAKLNDKASVLYVELEKISVSYLTEGIGRGAKSWFVIN